MYAAPHEFGMLQDQRVDVDGLSVDGLRAEYDEELRAVIDGHGPETVAAESDVDVGTVSAIADGESPPLSLSDAAAILALGEEYPDAETIETMACEHLLLGMSMAVLDVDALASEVRLDLSAKEIQQKLERRAAMDLAEFVAIEYAIADRHY